jgi:uncharacterized membrane protein YczE
MNSHTLRHMLLKSYFPTAFLIAIILAILDATMTPVHGQVRTVTVTVYVTLVQTVPVYVPVTAYVTVASVATSFITFTSTAVSISLGTVTLWNTVTTVTTAMGVFGAIPGMIFGPYSDLGLIAMGTVVGALLVGLIMQALERARAASSIEDSKMSREGQEDHSEQEKGIEAGRPARPRKTCGEEKSLPEEGRIIQNGGL